MLSMNRSSFSLLQMPYTVESASYCAGLKHQASRGLITVNEFFPTGYCYVSCRRRTRWKAPVTARNASAGRRAATTCGCTCTTMTPARNWTSTRVGLLLFRPEELLYHLLTVHGAACETEVCRLHAHDRSPHFMQNRAARGIAFPDMSRQVYDCRTPWAGALRALCARRRNVRLGLHMQPHNGLAFLVPCVVQLQGTMGRCTACALRRAAQLMPRARRTAQSASGGPISMLAATQAQVRIHCVRLFCHVVLPSLGFVGPAAPFVSVSRTISRQRRPRRCRNTLGSMCLQQKPCSSRVFQHSTCKHESIKQALLKIFYLYFYSYFLTRSMLPCVAAVNAAGPMGPSTVGEPAPPLGQQQSQPRANGRASQSQLPKQVSAQKAPDLSNDFPALG